MYKLPHLLKPLSLVALIASSLALTACDNAKSATAKQAKTATTTENTTPASSPSITIGKNDAKVQKLVQENFAKSGIDTKVISAIPTSMPNMYWVKAEGMPTLFTDSTGQYIIQGEIIKVGGSKPEHISGDLQARAAKETLATIDKKDMIIFPAKGATKGVINVFTDADCGYCRKLHSEINEINAKGIEVRYLPWPRSEQTFPIMEQIWCSKDRNKALTDAKNGLPVNSQKCANPVARIHDLGTSLGINGTPAIFTQEGKQIGGYLPPDELAKELNIQ